MTFRYYTSGSYELLKPSVEVWRDSFQANVTDQFANAPNYYTIEEEAVFASGSYTDVNVRISSGVDSITGVKLGDDWKRITFSDVTKTTGIGRKYRFDNNVWITIFSDEIKSVPKAVTVKRCNSTLRWLDENGVLNSEECSIDYDLSRTTDRSLGSNPVLPEGFLRLYAQSNAATQFIVEGDRFLFGTKNNRVCYFVYGGGKRNFLNQETANDESSNLLQLIMGVGQVNATVDNIEEGIADYYRKVYAISLAPTSISGSPTDTYQVDADVTLNGNSTSASLTYATSASPIATVSGSGLVTLVSTGSAVITVSMTNNPTVSASLVATSASSLVPVYDIRVDPIPNYIYEGDTTTYSVGLYLNGTLQPDALTFTIDNADVPSDRYTFTTIDGNSFSVKNIKQYMDSELDITLASASATRQIGILLRGGW